MSNTVMDINEARKQTRLIMAWLASLSDNPLEHLKEAQALSDMVSDMRSEVAVARQQAASACDGYGDTELAKHVGVHRSAIYRLRNS
jgi:hypothetical protein|tara:strand:- start:1348 stop:1608 length:261 start_codon:yes stop_codon:yes gene_type:complete